MTIFPLKPEDVILCYDTETSGLPLFQEPSEDPRQPKIIQLTALQMDFRGNKLSSVDCLLRWPGLTMDEEALRTHGISPDKLERYGVDPNDAMHLFLSMWRRSTVRVAHNESFDARMVRIHQKQCPDIWSEAECDLWKNGSAFCTARATKPILQLPPTAKMQASARFRNSFKTPNLKEAYFWATGKELTGAHNAMYDVLAVKAVFLALQAHGEGGAQAAAGTSTETEQPQGGPAPVDPYPPRKEDSRNASNPAPSAGAYDW